MRGPLCADRLRLPDGRLSGEGLVLLLDLQLGRLQAQGFPGLQFLDAAIADPAFLRFGRQPAAAALHRVAAGEGRERQTCVSSVVPRFFPSDPSRF